MKAETQKLKYVMLPFLIPLIALVFLLSMHSVSKSKPEKIKTGLVLSPSVPFQLRQTILKNADSRKNLAVLCVNTGYRVFDRDRKMSSATEKIDQLIDIGADAVGLVYLNKSDEEKCLKILAEKKIPSFVISDKTVYDSAKADYFCYNDPNTAMNTAGHYIYNITEHKDRVAVITDTKPEHKKMALAFSGQYCAMAKMESMNIYAVNVPGIPQRFSVLSPSKSGALSIMQKFDIPGLREMVNIGKVRNAKELCLENPEGDYCARCEIYFTPGQYTKCPYCGATLLKVAQVSMGDITEERNINSAIDRIEKSKVETLYVIGDVTPLLANRRLMNKGCKDVRMVSTGCELLTLASIYGGNITANVEPDWRDVGRKFFNAIDCHFNNDLTPGKEAVSYIPKDYRYYSENSPLELPIGKGARRNVSP